MKYLAPLCLMLFLAAPLTASLPGARASAQDLSVKPREILTNDSIISLTKAGFKEMIEITTGGEIAERLPTLRDDEFFAKDEKAFFDEKVFKELPSEKRAKRMEDEAMIFGSQSGSGSKTQSRGTGPNGERQQQSETTGSATVRIVRPSGEPGGAMPKLERAPKLDNRWVVEMTQGGFTEGTIIRKIETSLVEFDLSPKAVEELKKNRISERVISVMKAAMDESK